MPDRSMSSSWRASWRSRPSNARKRRRCSPSMQTKAVALGRQLVDEERKLDRLFASATVTQASLQQSVTRIGSLQAEVRAAHLEAHLEQARILTPEQRARYLQLRGYETPGAAPHAH